MRCWAALIASGTLLGCHGDPNDTMPVCPRAHAAFVLDVSAESEPLPASLLVKVRYGGAELEAYSLSKGNRDNNVLCCSDKPGVSLKPQTCEQLQGANDAAVMQGADANTTHAADAGPQHATDAGPANTRRGDAATRRRPNSAPGESGQLQCEVWSNGAADLTITAHGYQPIERTLVAEADEDYRECSAWQTVHVVVALERGDGGPPDQWY